MQNESERFMSPATTRRNTLRRWLSLGTCLSLVALIWLTILPAVSRHPSLQAEIRDRKARKIDADAMFYTELEAMDDILERVDNFHRTHPTALWLPTTSLPDAKSSATPPLIETIATDRN